MSPIIEHISKKAQPRKLDEHQVAVISTMTEACGDLLTQHFKDIESVRKENKTCSAQIAVQFTIGYDGGNAIVNTNIAFSKKFKDGREDHVGDPRQKTLFNEDRPDYAAKATVKASKKAKAKLNGNSNGSRVDFGTPVSEVLETAASEKKVVKKSKKQQS